MADSGVTSLLLRLDQFSWDLLMLPSQNASFLEMFLSMQFLPGMCPLQTGLPVSFMECILLRPVIKKTMHQSCQCPTMFLGGVLPSNATLGIKIQSVVFCCVWSGIYQNVKHILHFSPGKHDAFHSTFWSCGWPLNTGYLLCRQLKCWMVSACVYLSWSPHWVPSSCCRFSTVSLALRGLNTGPMGMNDTEALDILDGVDILLVYFFTQINDEQ